MAIVIPVVAFVGRVAAGAAIGYLAGKAVETLVNSALEKEDAQEKLKNWIGKNKVTKVIGNTLFEPRYEFRIEFSNPDVQTTTENKEV